MRILIIFSSLCVFNSDSFTIVTPGPSFPPTKGSVWPKPKQQIKDDIFYTLPLPTVFNITVIGQTCDILTNAIDRYRKVLTNTYLQAEILERKLSEKLQNAAANDIDGAVDDHFKGTLEELKIDLRSPCETYPHLDMDEKYNLNVSSVSTLTGDSIWGILRGLETFVQLMYMSEGYKDVLINKTVIDDSPLYTHRGLLIDTSRHYLPVKTILNILDAMEMNKMNVLHWHIVDDQSFPYQSDKFPELSKAAYSPLMIYTKEDIVRIVEYAKDRGIRVLPEFDVPGHTSSWGVAYPDLLTKCYNYDNTVEGLGPMDPTKNFTYDFIRDLFQEVQQRFPDKYLHIGGDEVEMNCWLSNIDIINFMKDHGFGRPGDLHSYFMSRVIPLLSEDHKPIVWQEVFDEGVTLPNGTIVQVWKSSGGSKMIDILSAGHKVLYSTSWYLDHINGGGDWNKYYTLDPRAMVKAFTGETTLNLDNILGGEACMWAEVVDENNVISRVWPRASAVAEVLWSGNQPSSNVFYHLFSTHVPREINSRLEEHTCRMNRRRIRAQPPNGPGFCVIGSED